MVPQTPLMTAQVLGEETDTWMDVQVSTLHKPCLGPDGPLSQKSQQKYRKTVAISGAVSSRRQSRWF